VFFGMCAAVFYALASYVYCVSCAKCGVLLLCSLRYVLFSAVVFVLLSAVCCIRCVVFFEKCDVFFFGMCAV
jgi:hypothetical protein